MPDPLPFEFLIRADEFVPLPGQMQEAAIDERDRQLEDFLQQQQAVIDDLVSRVEALESP